jgi:hypothetical protein
MMAPVWRRHSRVGQNSIFSFARDSREIELQQGSILFQSPTGKGGGTIRTPAASAAVLGTTLIVTTTKNGGFKVLLIEGHGRVRGANGAVRNLTSGQMVYALRGANSRASSSFASASKSAPPTSSAVQRETRLVRKNPGRHQQTGKGNRRRQRDSIPACWPAVRPASPTKWMSRWIPSSSSRAPIR